MRIGLIGMNHKSAAVGMRERFAQASRRLLGRPTSWRSYAALLLSTCNRTEIYFSSSDVAETHGEVLALLREEMYHRETLTHSQAEEFEPRLYAYFGRECFLHLASVTTGMDSALVGETEIQGQVKRAYEEALSHSTLPHALHFLFQKCLKIGKAVRTAQGLTGRNEALEARVVALAEAQLGSLHEKKILFVGFSEMNSHLVHYCRARGFPYLTLCNRSARRPPHTEVALLPWEQLSSWTTFDLIFCATTAPHFLLHPLPTSGLPKVVMDLSVPRNVHPEVAHLPGIFLFNLDHIYEGMRTPSPIEVRRLQTEVITELVEREIGRFAAHQELAGSSHTFSENSHTLYTEYLLQRG